VDKLLRYSLHSVFQWEISDNTIAAIDISTLNMSETIQDSAIITVECQWELVCDLSNGAIFNDLE